MIQSKDIVNILEEYLGSVKVNNQLVSIYKNPSSSDIQEIVKNIKNTPLEVRFILDISTNSVYVWDAYLAVHDNIFKSGLLKSYASDSQLTGVALIQGSSLKFHSSDIMAAFLDMVTTSKKSKEKENNWLVKFINQEWSWAYRYIKGLDIFINQVRYELDTWVRK